MIKNLVVSLKSMAVAKPKSNQSPGRIDKVNMQPKPNNLSIRPVKQRNTSSVEVSVLLRVHCLFLRITLMSGLLLLVTGRALLMSSKERNASRDGLV